MFKTKKATAHSRLREKSQKLPIYAALFTSNRLNMTFKGNYILVELEMQ